MQDVIQRPELAYVVVVAGALSLPGPGPRRHGALAAASLAMGTAALPAGPHPVTAGFILIAILGSTASGLRAGWWGMPIILGAMLAAWASHNFLATAGVGPTLLGAVAIIAVAAPLLWIWRFVPTVSAPPARAARPGAVGLLFLFLLLAIVAPHLSLVFLGAAGTSWLAWRVTRTTGMGRWPAAPAVVSLLLLGIYLFMATVAGPEGLSMEGLADLPFSPAAETLLAAALLVASWLSTGLWPLHRWTSAPLLAPAAAVLLVRVGLVASPAGMEHWRTLAAPIAMLGIWHAAAARWAPGLAVGGAWLALIGGDSSGGAAATVLLAAALALDLLGPALDGERWPRRWGRGLAMLAAGWGGLHALVAGLHGEVVYTVMAAAGAALGISGVGQAMTPRAPRSTLPSA